MKLRGIIALIIVLIFPFCALAEQSENKTQNPILTQISFNNAKINGEFSPSVNEYTLTLDDPSTPPTLKNYEIEGRGHLFINYILDKANHQTGVSATVEYENGSVIYNFKYSNAKVYEKNSNNLLKELGGEYVQVYPELNKNQTHYRVYIPKDMTVLRLTAVTQDIGAYCDIPKEITINTDQEPSILVTVTASDGTDRVYTFNIKRSELTVNEVAERMAKGDFSYADELLFYRRPAFLIGVISAAAGLILVFLLLYFIKRVAVKAEDVEEPEFFEV